MRVVVQKVNSASVSVNQELVNKIENGLCLLVGFTQDDDIKDIEYMVKKVVNLRIFEDENNVMNKSVLDVGGKILSISQFTLYGDTKKGNRPSYIKALNGANAVKLYDKFNELLNEQIETKTGIFGADMIVNIVNNGPTTIIIDTKN
ncbi:MAG: D-tyrosyl-tRNA(Tyr) deacylase [Firmicutes bacterium]|nr:D-tyrosyl-tRNA(Tyr) deacylase [Bacillota bacterium]